MGHISNILFYILLAETIIYLIAGVITQDKIIKGEPEFWKQMGSPKAFSLKSFWIIVCGRGLSDPIKTRYRRSLRVVRILLIGSLILFIATLIAKAEPAS